VNVSALTALISETPAMVADRTAGNTASWSKVANDEEKYMASDLKNSGVLEKLKNTGQRAHPLYAYIFNPVSCDVGHPEYRNNMPEHSLLLSNIVKR